LADNGGATQTHALVTDSPAIDAGDNALCSDDAINSFDQRGVSRPQGSACDIGSFEVIVNEEVGIEEATFFTIPLPNGKSATFGL